jgi:hypothetical protein
MGSGIGNVLILAGIVLILAGVLAKYGLMGWFGHLPGDIRIKGEYGAFYFPLTTMILLSVVLSLLLQLIRKF